MLQEQDELEQLQNYFDHNLNNEAQTLIASTILQIDELSDTVISELASEFQSKHIADLTPQKSQLQAGSNQLPEQNLQTQIKQTLSLLLQVKFHLTILLQMYLGDKLHNEAIRQIQEDIRKFRKVILLLESQMSMILWILENKRKAHFREKYFEKYNQLQHFAIAIDKINDGYINFRMVVQVLETVKKILHQYIQFIIQLKESIQNKKKSKYLLRELNRLYVINAKVLTISQVLPYCCTVQKEDLFSYPPDHPRWRKLVSECIIYRSYADKQKLKSCFDSFKKNLNLVNATMGILNKTRKLPLLHLKSWLQIAYTSKYIMKLVLFKDAARKQAEYMISSASTQLMKEVWNLPEHKFFRDFAQLMLPSIQHSQRLYIPRIAKQYFNSNGTLQIGSTKIAFLTQYGNDLFKKNTYQKRLRIRINSKYKLMPKFKIIDSKAKKTSQGSGLIVQKVQRAVLNLASICGYRPKYVPEKLVFHIHGGGFISMSSFIHQIYTRAWAKQLEVPFISVDYGKAPQHPYPEGLYDCLQAYIWTLHYFEQTYHAKPNKIIFLGDSAGGNLAAALINLCIAWNLRIPDGLVICYPVLSVTTKKYTKSLLGTLEDMILPHTLLKLCQSSYSKNSQIENDPLISPLFTPNQFLQRFPETRIFVGSKDPFHDDCIRFTQRMNLSNPGKCFLTIFQQFPHAFLQFDIKTHPNQYSRKANDQICKTIGKMFDGISSNSQK